MGTAVVFTSAIDALIREIDAMGGAQQLWCYLYRNRRGTPMDVIEQDLRTMRDSLAGVSHQ